MKCNLFFDNDALSVTAPYDAGFVAELKSVIPANARRWNAAKKAWLTTAQYGAALQNLCMKYFNELPLLPDLAAMKPAIKSQILDVRYIGATKDRGTGEFSAFGWHNGGWNVVFPDSVLRAWFDAPQTPNEAPTLYSVLGVKREATDDEIKSGYRRMARQWHPDRNKEPNAQEQFMVIQRAYEILSKQREKYDAGLTLEASLRNSHSNNQNHFTNGYRSPLRSGLILCDGYESLGIFNVTKIQVWEDIKDNMGRTLISSWGAGDKTFTEIWA